MKTFLHLITFYLLLNFTDAFSQNLLVRRNVKNFTQTEINEFTAAIIAMKNRPSLFDPTINAYDYFPKLHWEALNPTEDEMMMYGHVAHTNPGFLTWHREFIRRFEMELRVSTSNPNYMMPYWDWTDRTYDTYIFSANFMGGTGVPNSDPTYKYEVLNGAFGRTADAFHINIQTSYDNPLRPSRQYLQRQFGGSIANTLPTAADVTNALNVSTFDVYPWNTKVDENQSFRQFLEGFRYNPNIPGSDTIANQLHGRVHIFVSGHLLSDASPNDPLFFLLHTNVDRFFAEWQNKYGSETSFPQMWEDTTHHLMKTWDDLMYPFDVSHRSVLKTCEMGYIYDTPITDTIITTNISSGTQEYFATGTITATNQIISPANVSYKAGKAIVLNAGFSVESGSVFRAEINGCR